MTHSNTGPQMAPDDMQTPPPTADSSSPPLHEASAHDAGLGDVAAGATTTDADPRQRELEEARDKYLRLAAEFDNFRRRAAKERQEAGWRAQGELVRGILDVLDDITRFAHVDPATTDTKTLVDGVAIIEKKLTKSLAGHGFEIIDPTGHAFDPTLHEAVTTAPAERAEADGTVAVCFQVGYLINGHVLRPARVVVKQWAGA